MHITTLTGLAGALGRHKGYVSKLTKRSWFPAKGPDGWDLDEVRSAIAANVRQRGKATSGARPRVAPDDPLLLALTDSDSDPLTIARTAARLAARAVAEGLVGGRPGARDLDNLKRTLEELRRSEEDYMALEVRRGELIERDVAKAVAGGLAQRLIEILNNVEAMLPTQFEIWAGDESFMEETTERRARQIRDWFDAQAVALRSTTADSIEAMIQTEATDS